MAEIKSNPIIDHIAATAQAMASDKQAAIDVATQLDEQEQSNSAAQVAQQALGGAKQVIISQKNSWEAATDATVKGIRADFGANANEVGSNANYWMKESEKTARQAYEARDALQAKQGISMLSDPLGWINAQFSVQSDAATFNYYVDKHNEANSRLDQITQSSDAQVIATQRSQQKTSTEYAIAQGEEAAQTAAYNISQLKDKAAGDRIKGIVELNNLTAKDAALALQLHQANNSDRGLALQAQAHKDMMADRADRAAERAERAADKTSTLQDQEDFRNQYNANARRNNQTEIPDNKSWRTVFAVNAKNPDFWAKVAAGQQIIANDGASTGIPVAASAGHAAVVYAGGGTNLKKDPVAQFLFDKLSAVKANPQAPKDPEALAAMVTKVAVDEATNQARAINPNVGNIYSAPPVAVVMGAVGPKTDPFLATVVKPLVDADPNVKINDDVLFGQAFDFAKGNSANFNTAAAGIKAYYDQAVLQNNKLKEYTEKGLPAQVGYNVVINGQTVDATNITAIKKAMITANAPGYGASPFGFR